MKTPELLRNSYAPEDPPGEEADLLDLARRAIELVAKRGARSHNLGRMVERLAIQNTVLIRGTEKNW